MHINAGSLRLASGKHSAGIRVEQVEQVSNPLAGHWVLLFESPAPRGLVGFGHTDPLEIPSLVRGAEIFVAQTSAVIPDLHNAYGIAIRSVEDLGALSSSPRSAAILYPPDGAPILHWFGWRPALALESALCVDAPKQSRSETRSKLIKVLS